MAVTHYQQLIAWQKAMDLVALIYDCSRSFPADERFGLTSQLRRSAVSIPSNIAEGQGRGSTNEFRHFLRTAMSSLQECQTQLFLAERLGFLDPEATAIAIERTAEVARILHGLIGSLERKSSANH